MKVFILSLRMLDAIYDALTNPKIFESVDVRKKI
jgi:hypothetical protein